MPWSEPVGDGNKRTTAAPPAGASAPAELPYCFLDVDGTVSPLVLPGSEPPSPRSLLEDRGAPLGMRFPAHLPRSLERLAQRFRVVWLSSWNEEWPRLAVRQGLPLFPALAVAPPAGSLPTRARALARFVGSSATPFVWVDDSLAGAGSTSARRVLRWIASPNLLVAPDPTVGITLEHVKSMIGFATHLPRGGASAIS